MPVLTREVLLGARPPRETVYLADLGGDVLVRGMTGAERDAFEVSCVEGKGRNRQANLKNLRARLVAFCCITDDGARVFSDEDAAALGDARADVLDTLFTVAQRLSGMSKEDADGLANPSSPTVGASSSSPSRVN